MKRTKEQLIKLIENETHTKLNREQDEYLIKIGQYRFQQEDKIIINVFKPYKQMPGIFINTNISLTSMQLLTEFMEILDMEVLENEN